MKWLVALSGASLVACSPTMQTTSVVTSRPLVIGNEADIENASLLATKCNLDGTKIGRLNGRPALYIERDAMRRALPVSPAWECFTLGLLGPEFSDRLGLVGSEVARPR